MTSSFCILRRQSSILTHILSSHQISRKISSTSYLRHNVPKPPAPGQGLSLSFTLPDGNRKDLKVSPGDSILDIAHANDIDLEGACEGSLACSTCHIILPEEYYDLLEEPGDDENDMLDLAFGLTETSRLGCQVIMTKELDGINVKLPSATRNIQKAKHQAKAA